MRVPLEISLALQQLPPEMAEPEVHEVLFISDDWLLIILVLFPMCQFLEVSQRQVLLEESVELVVQDEMVHLELVVIMDESVEPEVLEELAVLSICEHLLVSEVVISQMLQVVVVL